MCNHQILDKYVNKRALIKNAHNGHHKIGCVIYDKSRYCVLRVWV